MTSEAPPNGRRPLVAANWKMHFLRADAKGYLHRFLAGPPPTGVDSLFFPSFPLLPVAAAALVGEPGAAASRVGLGGQDLHPEEKGAHTGDVSAAQLVDTGCGWVLCGHSERRKDHRESDELVGRKVAAAAGGGLIPILCVGESREDRATGRTREILERQLRAGLVPVLNQAPGRAPDDFTLAYEPVWAIGTGETATPEIAQEAHRFLRGVLVDVASEEVAAATRILYGGSVKPGNAAELIAKPDLDGFLVGGASLDPERFSAIMSVCALGA